MEEKPSSSKRESSNQEPPHQPKKLKSTQQIQIPKIIEEIPKFPEEIIVELLARLPVKSLLKFRSVCKSWLALISTPHFIKTHFKISSNSFPNHRVMITTCLPRFRLKHCSALSLISKPVTKTFNVNYPKKKSNRAVWVVGSCNGLICIAISEQDLFLWNPCTKVSYNLPSMDVKMKPCFYNIFGFGYCESSDDYKVLGVFCSLGNASVYESIVKVYSLRSDSWKRIGDFNVGVPLDDSGKFVGGKIHLASSRMLGVGFQMDIVSLDLESEVYGIIEQPEYGEGVLDSPLAVIGGCLSVLYNYKTRADVWVMKEYGVKESWTKVVTVPYFSDLEKQLYSRPLCVLPNGVILLVLDSRLVVYDPKDNGLKLPETSGLDQFLDVNIYVESLVSPIPNARGDIAGDAEEGNL